MSHVEAAGGSGRPRITIDADRCKRDGLCAMACTRTAIQQEEKGTVPVIAALEMCYGCGECVAVCPQGAISHSDYPAGTVTPIAPETLPSYDQVMELIRKRRSHRLFKDKPVSREVIEQVLDAARFAPSGHNEQSTQFVVIQDPQTIRELAELTAANIGKLAGYFDNAIGRLITRFILGRRSSAYVANLAPEMAHIAKLFAEGTDWILREPPVVLLFHADSAAGSFMAVNANLAIQNATLAAEALGLGTYYTGFVLLAAERDPKINQVLSLPETHQVFGGLAMGYPRLKYKSWPERKPAQVTWL